MVDIIEEVEPVNGSRKKPNPCIETFYNPPITLQPLPLNSEQQKTHQLGIDALTPFPSTKLPTIAATATSESIKANKREHSGYNLAQILLTLHGLMETKFSGDQKKITDKASNIYTLLDYYQRLQARINKEKIKRQTDDGKEPIIDSIDFTPPDLKGHLSLERKEKTDDKELVLDSEITSVLTHLGYDVKAWKESLEKQDPQGKGVFVLHFDDSVSAKTKEDFTNSLKQCTALEHLQEHRKVEDFLTKQGKERYDFSKLSKTEKKEFVQKFKILSSVVDNQCSQLPTDANNILAKLTAIQTGTKLITESASEQIRLHNRQINRSLERMVR